MSQRDDSIAEIEARIKGSGIGFKLVKLTPTSPVDSKYFPACFLNEGDDEIVKHASTFNGYPCVRRLLLTLEIWGTKNRHDIKTIGRQLVKAVMSERLATGAGMREYKSFGPFNNGVPGVIAKQIILEITYTDLGTHSN